MPIRAVMFDIGGILEVIPEGGDPATRFPALDEEWNTRLGLPPGHLTRCVEAIAEDGHSGAAPTRSGARDCELPPA